MLRAAQLPQVFNSEDYVLHVQLWQAALAARMGYTRHFATATANFPLPRGPLQRQSCLPLDGKSWDICLNAEGKLVVRIYSDNMLCVGVCVSASVCVR